MEIRQIQQGDYIGFSQIMTKFYHYAGDPVESKSKMEYLFEKAINPDVNLIFIGAFDNNALVGLLSITFGESSYKVAPFVWCDDFYVDKDYRGQGIGKKLLDESLKIAKEKGCSNIMLGVGENETQTQKFYKKYGFIDLQCKIFSLATDK